GPIRLRGVKILTGPRSAARTLRSAVRAGADSPRPAAVSRPPLQGAGGRVEPDRCSVEGRDPLNPAPLADLLLRHSVTVLFAWTFAVQAGMPAPAVPVLLAAGALSASGQMDLAAAILTAMAATLGADGLWYALGRSQGSRVLGTLSRFSLDPDSFIRDAKERFFAHRVRYLVLAKFLPGLNAVAAGLAGAVP